VRLRQREAGTTRLARAWRYEDGGAMLARGCRRREAVARLSRGWRYEAGWRYEYGSGTMLIALTLKKSKLIIEERL